MKDARDAGCLLITGGHGMVGRNVHEAAAAAGWRVIAPDRLELDLADYGAVEAFFRRTEPDIVVHAAGRVGGIQANIANPTAFLIDNIDVGRNVVLAARATGIKRLLNLSSSCMYPFDAPNPLKEEMILGGHLEPTNEGYALAKIVTMRLCEYIRRQDASFQYRTMIPCNLYGRYDKFGENSSHLLPAIIRKIHSAMETGTQSVEIWGDGTARREFMYVGDLAEAVLHAVNDFDAVPDLMNIGLGYDFSVNEYYQTAADAMGWRGRFTHDLSKPVGMKQKLVDVSRQTAWGWSPRHDLASSIRATYAYYLESIEK
jgi:GDP-L-fucose synthase